MSTENAEKKNSRLWQAVRFTDPNRTKRVKLPGGFTATTVDANWVLERATELFGPCGQGWGWSIVSAFETPTCLCTVHIRLWYVFDGQRGEYDAIASEASQRTYKSGDQQADSDAFKKALTDAIKNALTKIGFLADIHQGRHDDPEYVRRSKAYVEAQGLRDRAQQAAGSDRQSDGDRDAETDVAPVPSQLTDEQRANALFIRLKRRDADLARSVSDQHAEDPTAELDALARELGKLLYADLAKIDASRARALMSDAPKGGDGKVRDPLAMVDSLDAALTLTAAKGA
jgi:hypothetical protein